MVEMKCDICVKVTPFICDQNVNAFSSFFGQTNNTAIFFLPFSMQLLGVLHK